jgi:hypothetical protein
MYKTFTQNDLIRFLYGEMDNSEAVLLKQALCQDSDLNSSFLRLKETFVGLEKNRFKTSASNYTIAKIKSFARGYSSCQTQLLGRIDLNLN